MIPSLQEPIGGRFLDAGGAVVNVRHPDYGARGDGQSDDTEAFARAARALERTGGGTLFVPAGVYMVGALELTTPAGVPSGVRWEGVGTASVVRRHPSQGRIARIGVNDITVTGLAFDNNGGLRGGGVGFWGVHNARVVENRFFDSRPPEGARGDRYGLVFGAGGGRNRNLWITRNRLEDVQLEIDFVDGATITDNHVIRGVETGSIGLFLREDGDRIEDVIVAHNRVDDPRGSAFRLNVDVPGLSGCVARRVLFLDNMVRQRAETTNADVIKIGVGDNSVAHPDTIFEDIVVRGNVFEWATTAERGGTDMAVAVFFNSGGPAGADAAPNPSFRRCRIEDNQVRAQDRIGTGFDLRMLTESVVQCNSAYDCDVGLEIRQLKDSLVSGNMVGGARRPYRLSGSRGGNHLRANKVVGRPELIEGED